MPKIAILASLVALALASDAPGSALKAKMRLFYASGDVENAIWDVSSAADTSLGGLTSCRAIALRLEFEENIQWRSMKWCMTGGMVLAWDGASQSLRPIRPVGEGMSLEVPDIHGSRTSYSTRSELEQTVSGVRFRVIETVAVTRDSSGRQVQRVREFFAPALATATSGVVEVPDSGRAGSWRIQSSYKLVRIAP